MKIKILKVIAFTSGVALNYWAIHKYFPLVWKSLHPLLMILFFALLIMTLAISSAAISVIETGFSAQLPQNKNKKKKSVARTCFDWSVLFPIKLFIFTFPLYLLSSYYWKLYSKIYNNPAILENIGLRSWPLILAPFFALLLGTVCGVHWVYNNCIKKRNNNICQR